MDEQELREKVSPTGAWLINDPNTTAHVFDKGLCNSIAAELTSYFPHFELAGKKMETVDFGCGMGDYVRALNEQGFKAIGYDGNPNTPELSGGTCEVIDLSKPFDLGKSFPIVISLEVGEHIPPEFEGNFFYNIARHAEWLVILSWATPGQGGLGHFNERPNEYVIKAMKSMGFDHMAAISEEFRKKADNHWFKNTIMVFLRK